MNCLVKIFFVFIFLLVNAVHSFALSDETDAQRIDKLEELVDTFLQENRRLRHKVDELQKKLETSNRLASTATPDKIKEICKDNLHLCREAELCEIATYSVLGERKWKVGNYSIFVEEAKQRGLACGVEIVSAANQKSRTKKADNCLRNIRHCTNIEICRQVKFASLADVEKYDKEMERRGLSCGAKPVDNPEQVSDIFADWSDETICNYVREKAKSIHIAEVKRRGLSCGVKPESNQNTQLKNTVTSTQLENTNSTDNSGIILSKKITTFVEDILLSQSNYKKYLFDKDGIKIDKFKVQRFEKLLTQYTDLLYQNDPEIIAHFNRLKKDTSKEYLLGSLAYLRFIMEIYDSLNISSETRTLADIFSIFGDSELVYANALKKEGTKLYNLGNEDALSAKIYLELAAKDGILLARYKLEEMNARYLNYIELPKPKVIYNNIPTQQEPYLYQPYNRKICGWGNSCN